MAPVMQLVRTEFGLLEVHTDLLALWNQYGWPTDETLKDMVADYQAEKTDSQ